MRKHVMMTGSPAFGLCCRFEQGVCKRLPFGFKGRTAFGYLNEIGMPKGFSSRWGVDLTTYDFRELDWVSRDCDIAN